MSQGEIVRPADLGLTRSSGGGAPRRSARRPDRVRQRAAPRAAGGTAARASTTSPSAAPASTSSWLRSATRCASSPKASDRRARTAGISPTSRSRSTSSRRWRSSACSASPFRRATAAWDLGKEAMCVVTEELSRGYIGVGSLGTRSEIAAELIAGRRHRGAEAHLAAEDRVRRGAADGGLHRARHRLRHRLGQDARDPSWRRRLPHPRQQDLDHPCRARRSDGAPGAHQLRRSAATRGSRCCSRRSRAAATPIRFPAAGMSGTEIEVLGYRGMKEYEIAFDGFEVPAANLLGGVEGRGFKQLMQTLRGGAHPDRGARRRRRSGRAGDGASTMPASASNSASRSSISRASPTSSR